ncbi:MAG: hypothetical protein JSW36_09310 [Burkholderiales bacterium]|nr:MAG: hypothetical protein JSW36_09310 [Burkholderiales bacterium]
MSGSNSSVPAVTPDEPLTLAVHSLPEPRLHDDTRRTVSGRIKMLLVLAACAAPVVASYFAYFVLRPQARTNYSTLIEPTRPMPSSLPLSDINGRSVQARSLGGQWLIVVVAGGACDGSCEKALYLQRQLREMTGRERDRIDKVWLIPDDAAVRPELLAAVTAAPAPVWVLRVPREALAAWLQPAPGETLERHLYIVDPMGKWMMRAPADPEPARLKRDIERLLRASSSWDRAGR